MDIVTLIEILENLKRRHGEKEVLIAIEDFECSDISARYDETEDKFIIEGF